MDPTLSTQFAIGFLTVETLVIASGLGSGERGGIGLV
jgi:hypothetical protein